MSRQRRDPQATHADRGNAFPTSRWLAAPPDIRNADRTSPSPVRWCAAGWRRSYRIRGRQFYIVYARCRGAQSDGMCDANARVDGGRLRGVLIHEPLLAAAWKRDGEQPRSKTGEEEPRPAPQVTGSRRWHIVVLGWQP